MSELIVETNFSDPDAFYAALADLHRDRSPEDSQQINARLILLLANHIGDQNVLAAAMTIAGDIEGDSK